MNRLIQTMTNERQSNEIQYQRHQIRLASVAQTKPRHARCGDVTRAFKLMAHWRQLGGVRDYVAKFTKDASNSDLGFRCVTANITAGSRPPRLAHDGVGRSYLMIERASCT